MNGQRNAIRAALLSAMAGLMTTVMVPSLAAAAEASAWSDDLHSAVRLIGGASPASAKTKRAGIEIKMGAGWKTYWRYPGDAGVPPRFDFSGSDNLATAKVLWPAPHSFTDESGISIGYKNTVIFPLAVTPREPGKPVTLKLKIDYAVCEKLCIPATGSTSLMLDGKPGSHDTALTKAETLVPQVVTATAAGLTVRRMSGQPKPLVFVDLPAPDGKQIDLFAEGPNAEWALPVPKPTPGAPKGRRHFSFELAGLPPGVDPKGPFELTFTVTGGERPLEITTRLD